MDENMALNELDGENASLDTMPVSEEKVTGEVAKTQVESTDETGEEVTETGESKKGASQRIRELNEAKKKAEERALSLEEKLAELTKPVGFQGQVPQFNPQEPIVKAGEEIDAQDFEQKLLTKANAIAEIKIKQSEAINRINSEAAAVIGLYPELNPDSDDFNQELSDSITEATEAYVKASPYTASVKKFVAKLMKPYKEAVSKEVGKATENIAKQVSETALRPTAVKTNSEKPDSELSIAELEAKLGVVY